MDEKLQSAGELYGFMMDCFYHGRAFVLELMVVVILVRVGFSCFAEVNRESRRHAALDS